MEALPAASAAPRAAFGGLIGRLPDGPLDVVGDVHGEYDALRRLLLALGYDDEGNHPQGRMPVFVGDLVDRGGQSLQVARLVRDWARRSRAMYCMGNHELNILMNDPKEGSGWYFGGSRLERDREKFLGMTAVSADERAEMEAFFSTMPLALRRDDLRIVHAAWLSDKIARIERSGEIAAKPCSERCDAELEAGMRDAPWLKDYLRQKPLHEARKADRAFDMPELEGVRRFYLRQSQDHSVKAVLCGVERPAKRRFFAAGSWRFTERAPWWDGYLDDTPVIVGHYWRSWGYSPASEDFFQATPESWFGPKRNVFCVDYSIGALWKERLDYWRRCLLNSLQRAGFDHPRETLDRAWARERGRPGAGARGASRPSGGQGALGQDGLAAGARASDGIDAAARGADPIARAAALSLLRAQISMARRPQGAGKGGPREIVSAWGASAAEISAQAARSEPDRFVQALLGLALTDDFWAGFEGSKSFKPRLRRLAALRWPENYLVFHDGQSVVATGRPPV